MTDLAKIRRVRSFAYWKDLFNRLVDHVTPESGSSIFRLDASAGNVPYADVDGKITSNWIRYDGPMTINTAGGADLVLTEDTVSRTSGSNLTLTFDNPGAGALNLVAADLPTAGSHLANKTYVDSITSMSSVRGLIGHSPTASTLSFSAESVLLRNAAGNVYMHGATGTVTNNLATFAVNGRDNASSYAASTNFYLFFIWNGTTLSTLTSTSSSAPTLPSGYTHWALVTGFVATASNTIALVRFADDTVYFVQTFTLTTAQSTLGYSTLVYNARVPSLAKRMNLGYYIRVYGRDDDFQTQQLYISIDDNASGSEYFFAEVDQGSNSGADDARLGNSQHGIIEVPVSSSTSVRYKTGVAGGQTKNIELYVRGYKLSNGS